MHGALFTLIRLRWRGFARRMFRGVKTKRGAITFGAVVLFLLLCIGPSLAMGLAGEKTDPQLVRNFAPLMLLAFCVMTITTSVGDRAVSFTPAEVDFLFAGPFTRRELLIYKIVNGVLGASLTALWCSVFAFRHVNCWVSAYVSLFLSFMFIQLLSMAAVQIRQIASEHAYTRARRLVIFAVFAVLATALVPLLAGGSEYGPMELVARIRQSSAAKWLLAPFDVFARTMTAEVMFPELVGWAGLAGAINLALVVIVIKLDANYLEAAAAISQKTYQRIASAKRSGGMTVFSVSGLTRFRLPTFAWAGGAGPILWRRLTHAVRASHAALFLLLAAAGLLCTLAAMGKITDQSQVMMMIGAVVYVTVFTTMMVPFDFRGDLDHIDWLKMLPIRPIAVTLGELAGPVLIMTLFQATVLCVSAVFAGTGRAILLTAAAYSLPFTLLIFGVENFIFLLFPVRLVTSPGDFQQFGRHLLSMLAKLLALLPCWALAAGTGAIAYFIAGRSWIAAIIVCWITLTILSAGIVLCVTWAYRRFDPSLHMPA